jgi:hypothetical protein
MVGDKKQAPTRRRRRLSSKEQNELIAELIRHVVNALHPPSRFGDDGKRLTTDARRARHDAAIAGLNRAIALIVNGDDVGGFIPGLLHDALTSGQLQLIPRHVGKGRRADIDEEVHIAIALHEELKKQNRKRAYDAVGKRFRKKTRRLEQIWATHRDIVREKL